ncbi:thioredoxin family protein [Chitinophaga japonensis]|uniref:Uncharacterized protein DUF255 n=1 Tax=Chitinophaga japonensis TaxID=104662 RepID=A0A562T272_CHIJA|nr:DUF255 domain-containing protein [Chitinophaga japonensis]TWI87779.1 uncharacterized protein DUF255 [Chitinophaga japonensis]
MKFLAFVLITIPLLTNAQDKGIHFINRLDWDQSLAKARSTNKLLFIDCYAIWCRPCRFMNDSIFSNQEVADFLNKNFINIKVKMDSAIDGYQDGEDKQANVDMIKKKYQISAYPTFLFVEPSGELVYRIVGTYESPESFIKKASKALDQDEQYFFLLEQYNSGRRNPVFISRLIVAAENSGDKVMANKLKKEYTPE